MKKVISTNDLIWEKYLKSNLMELDYKNNYEYKFELLPFVYINFHINVTVMMKFSRVCVEQNKQLSDEIGAYQKEYIQKYSGSSTSIENDLLSDDLIGSNQEKRYYNKYVGIVNQIHMAFKYLSNEITKTHNVYIDYITKSVKLFYTNKVILGVKRILYLSRYNKIFAVIRLQNKTTYLFNLKRLIKILVIKNEAKLPKSLWERYQIDLLNLKTQEVRI